VVKYVLLALLLLSACARPFVMKPERFSRPVMVGEIRQIGGKKQPIPNGPEFQFSETIESLDTPTMSAQNWHVGAESRLDSRLNAATLLGERDAQVTDLKFGSYVLNFVVFYWDKDWLTVSGHTLPRLYNEPERVYMLNPPKPVMDNDCGPREKCGKKARKSSRKRRR
jgi:hypothetical protein